jgi:surface protein
MANKLYLEENYVVWEVDGTPTGEYSKSHCVYRETTTSFIIKEEIDNGQLTILKTDVDGGNWLDGSDVAYTTAGLRTWLRANSGFKTAGGGSSAEFIMLVKTDNAGISASNQFIIPTAVGTYDYDVDWGDGNFSANVTGSVQHTYASAGTYTIKISGIFPRIQFNNGGDKLKLLEIQNWGTIAWGALNEAFYGCTNLDVTATDSGNFSGCTTLRQAFRGCTSLVGTSGFNSWDLSSLTRLDRTFFGCTSLNIDVPDWNVSNVTDFGECFNACIVFNSDLSNWDVSNATQLDFMFRDALVFNQNLSTWNLKSNLSTVANIFRNSGMSTANYTDTLVGWANYVFVNSFPFNVNATNQTGRTFDTSRSGGANFTNAGDARTYLTTATPTGAGWTISGDTVI